MESECTYCDGSGYIEETNNEGHTVKIQCLRCAREEVRRQEKRDASKRYLRARRKG